VLGTTAPAYTNLLVDADGEAVACVTRIPKSGSIRKLGLVTRTVTTGGDIVAEMQTVDLATAFPSGSLFNASAQATITIASSDDNVWKEGTLAADIPVVADDLVAFVFRRPTSGAFVGNFGAPAVASGGWQPSSSSSMAPNFAASAWSWNTAAVSGIGVQYSDGICYNILDMVPAAGGGYASLSYNNGSSPDNEYGNRFRLPITGRLVGLKLPADLDGDCQYVLYADDGTQLAISNTVDKDVRQSTSIGKHPAYFTSPYTIIANTWYRATVLPTSATSIGLRKISVQAQAWLGMLGAGQDFYQTSRNTGTPGTWNDVTTDRVLMSLMFDAFDDGASAGGVIVPGGMTGGMNRAA
jgi:hypothetical protein